LKNANGVLTTILQVKGVEMSKKKTVKNRFARPARSAKPAKTKQAARSATTTTGRRKLLPSAGNIHVYRHEVESNPNNAPLIVDIPIAAGRGKNPSQPTFVGFTAEMAEEQWPDQFAFRIISLEPKTVRVMISRTDKGSSDVSWGAKLVVHVLVIADATP
jgi:hypothetical protein